MFGVYLCVAPCVCVRGGDGVACCLVWVVSDPPPCDVRTCAWVASGNSHGLYNWGSWNGHFRTRPGPGATGQDEEEGFISAECVMRKIVYQVFGGFVLW